ncbi:MAG: methyltransferase small [Marmoricola sp.]|nr:methyltransferase small [Marmoricola sp.]
MSSTDPAGVSLAAQLREALSAADFTFDGVAAVLGTTAHAALSRNETLPGLRATGGGSPIETLTRLWLLQAPVPASHVERALPGLLDPLCNAGMLERSVGEVRARVDVRPYATEDLDLWITSDLTPGLDGGPARVAPDHVLGISSAATSLAQLTMREPVERALDLGTGCGVQSLHLAPHAGSVVATDVNQRALRLTRFNAELNAVPLGAAAGGIEVRDGSFFEPVAGELFDLVVTNPPFVISPATGERLVYRDSGLPGDRVVEHIVRGVPDILSEGGSAQVLANWMVVRGQPWEERLSGWMSGCDAWVVQREAVDLPTYVELWLKDAGVHPSTGSGRGTADYHERYDTWLSWFEEQGAEAVGFGWINLRKTSAPETSLRLEHWPYDVEQPIGPEVRGFFDRTAALRDLSDEALGATRLVARADLRQEAYGAPGAADPEEIVIRQQRWSRRARRVDTVEAALVGACDGELSVLQILDAVSELLDQDEGEVRSAYLPVVRGLVTEGFLELDER